VQKQYDYIILGAGLSGLTTALRMQDDAYFSDKHIAIIDQNLNKGNDRTWCFWETEPDFYESLVSYRWRKILVAGHGLKDPITIEPFTYKKVEGEAVYAFAKASLEQNPNVTFIEASVTHLKEQENEVTVHTNQGDHTARNVLNSIYKSELLAKQAEAVVLQQHFIGWTVKTDIAVFNPEVATYMDFSIAQKGNCRFMYVLPTSTTEALLEYTLFSKDLLPKAEYETAIIDYLKDLGVTQYTITATEAGSIPMTTYDFTQHNTNRILHIGTAGGRTKASTGYTFKSTLTKSKALVAFLKSGKPFTAYTLRNRWTFYDAVLLEVLAKHNEKGGAIFTGMFKSGDVGPMFRFLDETSSLGDDFKIIWSAPKWLFIKAAFRVIRKGIL